MWKFSDTHFITKCDRESEVLFQVLAVLSPVSSKGQKKKQGCTWQKGLEEAMFYFNN